MIDAKEIEQIIQAFLRRLSIYITNEEMKQIENNLKTLQYKKYTSTFFIPSYSIYPRYAGLLPVRHDLLLCH